MIKKFDKFIQENYIGSDSFNSFKRGKNPNYLEKRKRKYLIALEMEKRGKDPEVIRLATGWFKNTFDGKWRFEISNYKLSVNSYKYTDLNKKFNITESGSVEILLGDLIQNTSLFKEYPFFKKTRVYLVNNKEIGTGSYNRNLKTIDINGVPNSNKIINDAQLELDVISKYLSPEEISWREKSDRSDIPFNKEEFINNTKNKIAELEHKLKYWKTDAPFFILYEEHISVLLHEIQHMIQYIEGFAKGGNQNNFQPKTVNKSEKMVKKIHNQYVEKHPEFKAAWEKIKDKQLQDQNEYFEDPDVQTYQDIADEIGYTDEIYNIKYSDDILTPFQQYWLLAGEIESRDVQARMRYLKNGGWGIFDLRQRRKNDPTHGLYKMFKTKEEAQIHLKEVEAKHDEGKMKNVYNPDTMKHYPIKFLGIDFIEGRDNTKPLSSFDQDPDDVIVN